MDPKRHHEQHMGNRDDRSMYFNRGMDNMAPHTQYFPQDNRGNNNTNRQMCVCGSDVSSNILCNCCHEEHWKPNYLANTNVSDNADKRKTLLNHNKMYSMPPSNAIPYWQQQQQQQQQQNNQSFAKETNVASKSTLDLPHVVDASLSNKTCIMDTPGYNNYKQLQRGDERTLHCNEQHTYNHHHHHQLQQQQLQQHQQRDNYPVKHEPTLESSKITYASSPAAAVYNVDTTYRSRESRDRNHHLQHHQQQQQQQQQQHIINPSNTITPKEQQPSPNYGGKCPQIFSTVVQNNAHLNLYMTTPKFSSDKFTSVQQQPPISNEPPPSQQQQQQQMYHRINSSNSNSNTHLLPELGKAQENLIPMSSSGLPMYSSEKNYGQINAAQVAAAPPPPAQYAASRAAAEQSPPLYTSNMDHTRNVNYAPPPGSTKILHATTTTTELPPHHIMKQSHTSPYQYSSPSRLMPAKTNPVDVVNYPKKEEISYENHRSLYVNPYTAPAGGAETYCAKDATTTTTSYATNPNSNYYGELPESYLKYGKIAEGKIITTNKVSTTKQNTLPSSKSATTNAQRNTSFYGEMGNTSPAIATSPAFATSPQMLIQHCDHAPQTYRHQQTEPPPRPAARIHELPPATMHYSEAYDRKGQPLKCLNTSKIPPMMTHISPPSQPTPQQLQPQQHQQNPKKVPLLKPNYRELINQAYALRNATSEEELNMQIIKKALNVDHESVRSAPPAATSHNKISHNANTTMPLPPPPPPHLVNSTAFGAVKLPLDHRHHHQRSQKVLPIEVPPKISHDAASVAPIVSRDEKSNFYPLDLSMRTIKTKADSTAPSIQKQSQAAGGKYVLPKVDFTPNFSLHTTTSERSVKVQPSAVSTRMELNERSVITPKIVNHSHSLTAFSSDDKLQHFADSPMSAHEMLHGESKSQIALMECIAPSKQNNNEFKFKNPYSLVIKTAASAAVAPPPPPPPASLPIPQSSLLSRQCNLEECSPNILETNPITSLNKIKSEPKLSDDSILAVDQLPAETSVVILSKANVSPKDTNINISKVTVTTAPQQSTYSLACEKNPNFLGKKRHLQDFTCLKINTIVEPAIKQVRFSPPQNVAVRSNEIGVIMVNERFAEIDHAKTAEKSVQAEMPYRQETKPPLDILPPICKKEELSPTRSVPSTATNNENHSLIAARIRTKAELKGFTFNPPLAAVPVVSETPAEIITVKIEPPASFATDGLSEECTEKSLLDFSWNNACNNFVEQLLTTSKKTPCTKKKLINIVKTELSEDDLPVSTILLQKDSVIVSTDSQILKEKLPADNSRCDNSTMSVKCGGGGGGGEGSFDGSDSAILNSRTEDTTTVHTQSVTQKKTNKLDREKMRLQQEQRIAARLQGGSSSETECEIDKRKTERLKKTLKKARFRHNTFADKNRFSDCGSDSSTDRISADDATSRNNSKMEDDNPKDHVVTNKETINVIEEKKNVTERPKQLSNNKKEIMKNGDDDDDGVRAASKHVEKQVNSAYSPIKSNTEVTAKKLKSKSKVNLNTMTRSKRKKELELQLANSKVLRNDKVIRNSMTKIKRKYVRSSNINQSKNKSSKNEALTNKSNDVMLTRLRSKNGKSAMTFKKNKNSNNNAGRNMKKKLKEKNGNNAETLKGKVKERQTDIFLEVYRYKRALKVPPSLITIKHPNTNKLASSLPSLEAGLDATFAASTNNKTAACTKANNSEQSKSIMESKTSTPIRPEGHKSIIDLLHSRVTNYSVSAKAKATKSSSSRKASHTLQDSTWQNTESVSQQLPSLTKDRDEESADSKKRHFSIFETKVLQSKTRTESKMQQKKEIIREIFVGNDRPASAPPEISQASESVEKMTYEQKYEQFLQQMNIVISEDKLGKFGGRPSAASAAATVTERNIKHEDDTESTSAIDVDEKLDADGQHSNQLSMTTDSVTRIRRRRPGKYLRRKGSSGFDYIRKKKKPATVNNNTSSQHMHSLAARVDRSEERTEPYKVKTENDVCQEIQKWVLNKGVGQSTMHKAARLGYIDIIVYCLERMGMNPDQKDNAGYTPLHEACTNGWLEIARVLLQYGANHSEAAHSGIRPLHEASENDQVEIVRLLLSYGADPLLATYSGQTPLILASSNSMRDILNNHLSDVHSESCSRKTWRFNGPWEIYDASECGYDIFGGVPNSTCDMSRALRKTSIGLVVNSSKQVNQHVETTSTNNVTDKCAVVLDNMDRFNSIRLFNDTKPEFLVENSDSEGDIFEFEEADVLLPPLYLLKDEGSEKWVLLSDLCNLLKVKSKDTLLNKIYPSSSISSAHKNLMRELKMTDFLEKATCLQLLCAGEKINICSSKVVLIKYNESVRNLLGVNTILMKF